MSKDLLTPLKKPALQGQRPLRRVPKPLAERTTPLLVGSVALLMLSALFLPEGPPARASGPETVQAGYLPGRGSPQRAVQAPRNADPAPRARYDHSLRRPIPRLEAANAIFGHNGTVQLTSMPRFSSTLDGKLAARSTNGDLVFYTVNPKLQAAVSKIVRNTDGPHIGVVAMEPYTGAILAIAGKSPNISDMTLHNRFPAASLFKVVTTAAALEQSNLTENSIIRFRGGTYTLNRWNYLPDRKLDSRSMALEEALGKSCNPVFARVALKNLNSTYLRDYAYSFGFNRRIPFGLPLEPSAASVPTDAYGLSRTAAGFGKVAISPVHAAAFMSAVANGGLLPRPILIQRVMTPAGRIKYQSEPTVLQRAIQSDTAEKLLDMMHSTTTVGTSRSEFRRASIRQIRVAAKTGTLRGDHPKGVNHWFIAAAPIENPKIAVAVITVRPSYGGTKASRIGRLVLESYLRN